jgi:hypothetical protein
LISNRPDWRLPTNKISASNGSDPVDFVVGGLWNKILRGFG